jgi:hypothetical protein
MDQPGISAVEIFDIGFDGTRGDTQSVRKKRSRKSAIGFVQGIEELSVLLVHCQFHYIGLKTANSIYADFNIFTASSEKDDLFHQIRQDTMKAEDTYQSHV